MIVLWVELVACRDLKRGECSDNNGLLTMARDCLVVEEGGSPAFQTQ